MPLLICTRRFPHHFTTLQYLSHCLTSRVRYSRRQSHFHFGFIIVKLFSNFHRAITLILILGRFARQMDMTSLGNRFSNFVMHIAIENVYHYLSESLSKYTNKYSSFGECLRQQDSGEIFVLESEFLCEFHQRYYISDCLIFYDCCCGPRCTITIFMM